MEYFFLSSPFWLNLLMMIFSNPNFSASAIRCSILFTARISPLNPTSPAKQMDVVDRVVVKGTKQCRYQCKVNGRIFNLQSARDIHEHIFYTKMKTTSFLQHGKQ